MILGNWKRHIVSESDTIGAFGDSGMGDMIINKDHSYFIEGRSPDDSNRISVPGWSADAEIMGSWRIVNGFLELSIFEREGIPVYLRYEIKELDRDTLIIRSVLGGYKPEDYMVYTRRP
jgi:hypothetical protein